MNIADNIKKLRKNHGYTQKDLANILQVKPTAISAWESGRNKPLMDKVTIMATLFGVSTSDIVGDTFNKNDSILSLINETTSQLTPPRQQKVYDFAKNELTEQNKSNIIQGSFRKSVDEDEKQEVSYVGLLSAGHGCPNYDKERPLGTVTMRKSQIPSYYDLAFMVDGNSMCPTFENGEIVFIKQTTEVLNGQFGAIEINGEAFLKKMYVENQRLRLVSLNCEYDENGNRLYPDFYADEYDDLYVIGRVIV
ncbi:XRE family transcriptional regulator [Enterococcus hirae]|uniref:XRE family transcriptional regulator n=1 Tax=Enterococcus hirae TaxID=1354 RepID=UPI001094964D|nr:XRE family transcriptional regulator [Enterococcus hirae]TGY25664.1 XRE family transcriptional regulator [Enterococcus hirae]